MKKEQLTDRIIRNKLKYHASASPDHLWEAIEAELPVDDKKNRGIFWWMGGGFLCLALLSAVVFYFGTGDELTSTSSATSTSIVDAETVATSNEDAKIHSTTKKEPALNNATTNELIATAKTKTKSADSNLATAENAVKLNRKTGANTITNSLLNNTTTAKSEKITDFSNTQATDENVEASNSQTGETKVSAEAKVDIAAIKAASLSSLDLSSKELLPLSVEEKELDWPSLLQDPKCATFGKWLKLHFYADAYVSPDIAFRELESKEQAYERYASDRRSTESQLLSFSTGLRFSVVSNYGLSARTGIVYSQINEKFEYQQERSVKTSETVEINGVVISSDTTIQSGTQYITTYNSYRMLDVPLLLGYEVNFKKFSLSVNSGVYANLISRQKGDFLSPDNGPVTFSSDARDTYPAFRKRLNFSLYGSVAMYINLDKHWQFMMEPQMRYYLDPMTQSSYMVKQKYITAGLITGLRYRF